MSRPPRFFISPEQVDGSRITLTGQDMRHIVTVLRMKTGDELVLSDGQVSEYRVVITQLGKSELATEIKSLSKRELRMPLVTLCQGLPKSDKMDWIVQKATELGISHIVPIVTERTIVKVKDEGKRIERWRKIAREAAMQSNRPDIPKVEALCKFVEFLRTLNSDPGTLLLLPWEEGTVPIKNVLQGSRDIKRIIVLIGPEGGFSAAEAEAARNRGFHLVSLGPNILRTETAAIAVLSMLLYETSAKF
jgi:16S rRNA (uracil1498-N3)-methyltransferase